MTIVTDTLKLEDLKHMAARMFGDLVKAVVDVDRKLMAVDAELHADLEALLLQDGSAQSSLWGINLYVSTHASWRRYFLPFTYAARRTR